MSFHFSTILNTTKLKCITKYVGIQFLGNRENMEKWSIPSQCWTCSSGHGPFRCNEINALSGVPEGISSQKGNYGLCRPAFGARVLHLNSRQFAKSWTGESTDQKSLWGWFNYWYSYSGDGWCRASNTYNARERIYWRQKEVGFDKEYDYHGAQWWTGGRWGWIHRVFEESNELVAEEVWVEWVLHVVTEWKEFVAKVSVIVRGKSLMEKQLFDTYNVQCICHPMNCN